MMRAGIMQRMQELTSPNKAGSVANTAVVKRRLNTMLGLVGSDLKM
jgi:hypothetical protein